MYSPKVKKERAKRKLELQKGLEIQIDGIKTCLIKSCCALPKHADNIHRDGQCVRLIK